MESRKFSTRVGENELIVETGMLAKQANGSVTVKLGGTMVLATAVMSKRKAKGMDYFPLMVDYEERYYAGGKIKGSRFIKREGRPSEEAVLNSRLIDRTIRPLFDHRMRNEVQVVATVLSIDQENAPEILSIIAASLALGISNIPWSGPVSAVRVGKNNQGFIINPSNGNLATSPFDLVIAGTAEKINMVEAAAKETPEAEMAKAFHFGFEEIKKLCEFQKEIIREIGKKKTIIEFEEVLKNIEQEIIQFFKDNDLKGALYTHEKTLREAKMDAIQEDLFTMLQTKYPQEDLSEAALHLFEETVNDILHDEILSSDNRPDGRKLDQVRPIDCLVGLLPRTHGSGVFQRGDTQTLTTVTLGSPGSEMIVDTMETNDKKRYMHFYNFPPYSVGEVKPMRGPGRREIGHGALAEKALIPVIPSKDEFPYTMLLVSETLASNGSSSMASTCGSTLALMDAGVPIKDPVSGIAMGIIVGKEGKYKILSDIQGPEDHYGDMDFKIAGTKNGITALQMDVKIDGITPQIAEEVFNQARRNRLEIMEKMLSAIPEPRKELSPFAPRIITIKIKPDKIRDVIGPGGKIINQIIDETGVAIDIEDDGTVFITSNNAESGEKAKVWIENLTKEVVPGEIYQGKVVKLMNFGAFVEILPNQEGMVHISEISEQRLARVEDVLKVGDIVTVKIKEIDNLGRINLTIKGAKNPSRNYKKQS